MSFLAAVVPVWRLQLLVDGLVCGFRWLSWNSRSVREIFNNVRIIQHSDTGSAVMSVVGTHSSEAMAGAVREILVLDA